MGQPATVSFGFLCSRCELSAAGNTPFIAHFNLDDNNSRHTHTRHVGVETGWHGASSRGVCTTVRVWRSVDLGNGRPTRYVVCHIKSNFGRDSEWLGPLQC